MSGLPFANDGTFFQQWQAAQEAQQQFREHSETQLASEGQPLPATLPAHGQWPGANGQLYTEAAVTNAYYQPQDGEAARYYQPQDGEAARYYQPQDGEAAQYYQPQDSGADHCHQQQDGSAAAQYHQPPDGGTAAAYGWQAQVYHPDTEARQPEYGAVGSYGEQPQAHAAYSQQQQQALTAPAAEQPADAQPAVQQLTESGEPLWKEFNACEAFYGAYEGWVFKLGKHGLGYYKDTLPVVDQPSAPKQPAPAAKPKAIGMHNSIIKGLKPKGGGIAKKKTSDDADKPAYLREMEAWQKQACSGTSRGGSLVK